MILDDPNAPGNSWAAVTPLLRGQPRPLSASCARLQSWRFPAHSGDIRADRRFVADEPEGKADQERREGRHPRLLHRFRDGRGRHSERPLRRHAAADRGTSAAAAHVNSVRRVVSRVRSRTTGNVRVDNRK